MSSSLASTLRLTTAPSPASSLGQRITLLDNTVPSDEGLPPQPSSASELKSPGRRETLRRAIAQRKYRRPFLGLTNSDESLPAATGESPDPRAAGTVERVATADDDDVDTVVGTSTRADLCRTERSDTGGNARAEPVGVEELCTGRRKKGRPEKEISEIDVLYENQRGMFVCGIPFFSANGLLNFDPPSWQSRHLAPSLVDILTAQLPDPSWAWAWRSWYVDMTSDVDEEGWAYSFSFSPAFSWHGTHIWFHSFVRRRRWLRKRIKLPPAPNHEQSGDSGGGPHALDGDYFTIHSARPLTAWTWRDADADGREDSEAPPDRVADVPALMRALRSARLDREKVAAVAAFLEHAGPEVAYLSQRVPEVMDLMVFQASRRELLALLASRAGPEAIAVAEVEVGRREFWSLTAAEGDGGVIGEGERDSKGKGKAKGKGKGHVYGTEAEHTEEHDDGDYGKSALAV